MIRLIIFAIGVFLLWVLFLSGLSNRPKIILCVSAIMLAIAGVWFEGYGETPRSGLIAVDKITGCGIAGEYSYRSNYNITFCLKNNSSTATAQRIELLFSALDCTAEPCRELDAVNKQLNILIAPGEQLERIENLAFDQLDHNADSISWKIDVVSVKATN